MLEANGAVPAAAYARENLTSRLLPEMTLSTAHNPLTAALGASKSTSPREKASDRFACTGTAVLTGGAGFLALASASALLEHGVRNVVLLDLHSSIDAATTRITDLKNSFPEALILCRSTDITDRLAIEDAFSEVNQNCGSVDILCCFAGVVKCVPSLDATSSDWKSVMDVNVNSAFLCAQAAAKHMLPPPHGTGSGGSILFISSISGHNVNFPQPQAAYNVSKAGVLHLTKSLAAEWAQYGIRVNSVSPGYMDTILNAGENLRVCREIWASRCPMGRMGDPDELTGAVILLCGTRSGRYITGTDIIVDGGASCF